MFPAAPPRAPKPAPAPAGGGSGKVRSDKAETSGSVAPKTAPPVVTHGGPDIPTRRRTNRSPEQDRQFIWNTVTSAVRNLIDARTVTFAPLDSPNSSLTVSGNHCRITGAVTVDTGKAREEYTFECEALIYAENYKCHVLNVSFHPVGK